MNNSTREANIFPEALDVVDDALNNKDYPKTEDPGVGGKLPDGEKPIDLRTDVVGGLGENTRREIISTSFTRSLRDTAQAIRLGRADGVVNTFTDFLKVHVQSSQEQRDKIANRMDGLAEAVEEGRKTRDDVREVMETW